MGWTLMTSEAEHMIRVMKAAVLLLKHTNRDVERKLGVSNSYLSRLFSGYFELRFDHIVLIAKAVGLKPRELVQLAFPPPEGPPTEAFRGLVEILGGLLALSPPPAVRSPVSPPSEEELERKMEKLVLGFLARLAGDREEPGPD
jgi:hypothetical protein